STVSYLHSLHDALPICIVEKDWKARSAIATTLVALAVRSGNPRGIRDFPDLARPGLQVIMPNPRISGGAMWNVTGIYGSARARRSEEHTSELQSHLNLV